MLALKLVHVLNQFFSAEIFQLIYSFIGYPDLKTIIESFDDIFVVHSPNGEWNERCEIAFNNQSVCKFSRLKLF